MYGDVTIEYVADGQVRSITSELPRLPEAVHTYGTSEDELDSCDLVDGWRFPNLCSPRSYRLRTAPLFQVPTPDPVATLADSRIALEIEYETPVPLGDGQTTTAESAALYEPWQPMGQGVPEESTFNDANTGVSISTWFYVRWGWGTPTSVRFEQTRIEGLTTEPIILTGYFSQSVGGGSHLCPKDFLFEPALEGGISQQTLDELRARNIRLIYYTAGARECRPTEWQDTPPSIRL